METCYKCTRDADYLCPECGTKICKYHMEFRYTGLDRGFRSRFMCPVCWLVKRVVPDDKMTRIREETGKDPYPSTLWDTAFTPPVRKKKGEKP